jgi:hypothetical protein
MLLDVDEASAVDELRMGRLHAKKLVREVEKLREDADKTKPK